MSITINSIIEIAGFPEKHVSDTMKNVLDKLGQEKGIKIIKKSVAKVKKIKEIWSTFAELELEFDNIEKLFNFCFDYMPSSIEIIEPISVQSESNYISNVINDMLAKLHQYTMFISNLNAENKVLKNRLSALEKK
ncbi:MAG: hypothetical protein AB1571_02225 [Nanoarchaeota archaeon]